MFLIPSFIIPALAGSTTKASHFKPFVSLFASPHKNLTLEILFKSLFKFAQLTASLLISIPITSLKFLLKNKLIVPVPEYKYKPLVCTVENGHNFAYDYTLLNEIPKEAKVYRSNSGETLSFIVSCETSVILFLD